MKSDLPLDYALFQLSPKRSRCDLFVSSSGNSEKLVSGLVKPFVTHLKVAEEQFARATQSIKLEVDNRRNAETWFTKGTLERFVQFVSTPEVVELANTFDAEMSQLEAARKIYSQGPGDQHSGSLGVNGTGAIAAADATKKELLKAIDVRLVALEKDLASACAHAAAAGFHSESVSELQMFADHFGAHRLNNACSKFLMLCQRRPELHNPWILDPNKSVNESPTNPQGSHRIQLLPKPSESEPAGEAVAVNESSQMNQPPARRLSVQERINMFESKQKESSATPRPVVVGKTAEVRRLSSSGISSDLSAAPNISVEKGSALRRWSVASDMSIGPENPLNSSLVSGVCNDKSRNVGTDTEIPRRAEVTEQSDSQAHVEDSSGWGGARLRAFPGRAEDVDFGKKASSQDQFEVEHPTFVASSTNKLVLSPEKMKVSFGNQEHGRVKDQVASKKQDLAVLKSPAATCQALSSVDWNKVEEVRQQDHQFAVQSRPTEVNIVTGFKDSSVSPDDDAFGDGAEKEVLESSFTHLKHFGSFGNEAENRVGKKVLVSSEKQAVNLAKKVEDFGAHRMRTQRQGSGAELMKKPQGRREDSNSISGNGKLVFPGKIAPESQDTSGSMRAAPVEQVQRGRQVKGNQELNDELKMKANELEKLFAEHKLRVPGDQSLSNRRFKATDVQMEPVTTTQNTNSTAEAPLSLSHNGSKVIDPLECSSNVTKFCAGSASKPGDYQDDRASLKPKLSELSYSDESRGKFYEKYMHKRDAKLKEEWHSKRFEKEAKLKSMHDNLEQSKAEMKEKFEGSTDRRNSVLNARTRAEKHRSFNFQSTSMREQRSIDFLQSSVDENSSSEMLEQNLQGQSSEASLGDCATSRSSQNKKLTPIRGLPSSIPRTSAIPVPRVSIKSLNGSGRRRTQSENPLAQSVPNFSDFRKENTKPSSGCSKTATRYRSKSTMEEVPLVKEEKSRRSQSLKKSSPSPLEFKDSSASDGVVLSPLQYDKDQTEQGLDDKLSKDIEPKRFLMKGYGIGPGSGAGITKFKASMTSETLKDEESADLHFEPEDCVDMVNDEDEEEIETSVAENSAAINYEKPRLSEDTEEYDRLDHSESENNDTVRSASQVDPAFVAEWPASVHSTFDNLGSVQDSPGESPVSWNSRMHLSFSYPHETSDIDVSADSPMGSPVSWNSHSLTQTEAEAARIRKKWGSSQKPVIVANSSQNHSRMDVTKGFKRLLKFGRKNRGTETLVDWISATTSEGDDDTEDGRDPANRSSEDLRKSRMGFSHGHPSKDGFNEPELLNEHALSSSIPAPPANFKLREDHLSGSSLKASRSFFSLSTFRSKGSESKPR